MGIYGDAGTPGSLPTSHMPGVPCLLIHRNLGDQIGTNVLT